MPQFNFQEYATLAGLLFNGFTLLILLWQFGELRKSIRLQTTLEATDKIIKIDQALIERPSLAKVFAVDPTLEGGETRVKNRAFMYMMLNYFATLFILKEKRYMDRNEWTPYENYLRSVLAEPEFQKLWAEIQPENWYYEPFQKYMTKILQQVSSQTASRPSGGGFETRLYIREVKNALSADFEQALEIYEQSFPESERETGERIRQWIQNPQNIVPDRYHLLVLSTEEADGHVLALAMFHYLWDANAAFLGYIAVKDGYRSLGYGSFLLTAVIRLLEQDAREVCNREPLGIFTELEVEDPADPMTYTRFEFWKRHNVLPLQIHWEYPLLQQGHPPAKMYLAYRPSNTEHEILTTTQAEEVARAIYRGVYRLTDAPHLSVIVKSIQSYPKVFRKTIPTHAAAKA